jgi:hypothetical protein
MFTGYSPPTPTGADDGDASDPEATGAVSGKVNGHKHHVSSDDESKWARKISPTELMDIFERKGPRSPRILHQSWKTTVLPPRFANWSREWRSLLDDSWM